MEFHNEVIGNCKLIENSQISIEQNLEELDVDTSNKTSDEVSINHDELINSEINIISSLNLSSLNEIESKYDSRISNLLEGELERQRSLVTINSCPNRVNVEIDTKKKIISSMLNILRNQAAETFCTSGCNKNIIYFYTLFQDCISNFIIEGFGGLVVDSMIDILIPVDDSFCEMELEHDLENYNFIPSILYYYLVGIIPNNIILSEKSFLNINYGERASTFLLPISRAVSEVDYAWLIRHNFPDINMGFSSESWNSKLENSKNILSIFTEEQIPNLIVKIIGNLKSSYFITKRNNIIEEQSITYLYKKNLLMGERGQTPFFIGRILEICLSKSQREFTSIFLQLDGPLVIIPFIFYSSIQDFFLRFFGFIGNYCTQGSKYNEFSNPIVEFEYLESNQESLIGEFVPAKSSTQEQFLEVGISSIIYEWVIESNFIQNFLTPLLDINCDIGDLTEYSELKSRDADILNTASGVIEVIFRLIEYLKPEHTGLPLNMTSIGLKWPIIASELNNPRNLNEQSNVNNDMSLSRETGYEISNLNKFISLEDSNLEGDKLNDLYIETSPNSLNELKGLEFENSLKRINSNKVFYESDPGFLRKSNRNSSYGAQVENCLTTAVSGDSGIIKNLKIYQIFEKSKCFIGNLIVDSPMLKLICELSIHESNDTLSESVYILKLRSLNILEEIINLAFSANINIIGSFKTKIMDKIKPYLTKFCEYITLKFETSAFKNKTDYMVSLLTIVKKMLHYDESRQLVNNLSTKFWLWLLDLLIKRRENSHISVQCKTIFELGLRFGSCLTTENLLNDVKLVDKLSKFIYDGTDLDGNCIEGEETVNKKTGKKIRRVFGSIYSLFMFLGRHFDQLLKMIVPTNPDTCEMIKQIVFSQLHKYVEINDETKEIINLAIRSKFGINTLQINKEKTELESSFNASPQKITSILLSLSCSTKFHEFVKFYKHSNKTSKTQNTFLIVDDSNIKLTKSAENSPNYNCAKKKYTDLESSSSVCEMDMTNDYLLSTMFNSYFSGSIVDLFKCDQNCECPKWSFCNVLSKLIAEKNYSSGISVFPILPLEESKKIRETRKRQMKLYSSIQKSDG